MGKRLGTLPPSQGVSFTGKVNRGNGYDAAMLPPQGQVRRDSSDTVVTGNQGQGAARPPEPWRERGR